MEKNNNLKNEIISTKANTLKALEKIITKAFIEEMLIIVVEDYVKNKREVALNIGKKFKDEVLAGVDMSMAAGIAVVAGDDRAHTDGIPHLHVRHVFARLDSGADSLVKGDDREGHEPVSAGEHLNVSAADANAAHFEKHLSVSALRGLAFGHDSFFGFRKHDSPHAFALFLSRTRRAAASMAEAVRP